MNVNNSAARDALISHLNSLGYDVYMRNPSDTYANFTDGTRIGYVQWSDGIVKYSTVHVPNRQVGTGFEASDAEDAIDTICPSWAKRDAGNVRTWRNWEEVHREYSLVSKGR